MGQSEIYMTLYHGTSTENREAIFQEGLKRPYLTSSYEIAQYYAERATEESGGDELVLEVSVVVTSLLRYDGVAMDEPVMVHEGQRDAAWKVAGEENPDWLKGDYIICPETAWEVSLAGVESVRYEGDILPKHIAVA